jgi:hypothetical protein
MHRLGGLFARLLAVQAHHRERSLLSGQLLAMQFRPFGGPDLRSVTRHDAPPVPVNSSSPTGWPVTLAKSPVCRFPPPALGLPGLQKPF